MKNYRICYIIDFIVYVSSHFLRSIFHCSCFISFSSVHNSFSYFIFIPFSPQSISSNLIKIDIHYLKLNSGGFTSPCLFILNKKYNRKNPSHGTVKSLKFHISNKPQWLPNKYSWMSAGYEEIEVKNWN